MFVVRLKRPNEDFDLKTYSSAKAALSRFRTAQREMIDGDVEECALFEPGAVAGKRITAETCVHFLHFCDTDYARLGHLIKCNPGFSTSA